MNALSLSRIPAGLGFVVTFQQNITLFYLSVALFGFALTTDLLDGYIARKLAIHSISGRHWDSLGDKSFYLGVIIAFNSQGFLNPVLSWALIVREVALYITRILYIENLPRVEQIRPFTNWHGYFMHVMILLGLAAMYAAMKHHPLHLYVFIQCAATASLAFGVASVFYFCRLR